jgi:hypothetical protein
LQISNKEEERQELVLQLLEARAETEKEKLRRRDCK